MQAIKNITPIVILLTFGQMLLTPVCLRALGAVHERIQIVNDQILVDPHSALLYSKRADPYVEHDEFESALADLETAKSFAGEENYVHKLIYSKAYYKMGILHKSLEFVDEFLITDKHHVIALKLKAEILAAQENCHGAMASLEAVVEHANKRIPDNYLSIVTILEKSEVVDYQHAYGALDRAAADLGKIIVFQQKRLKLLKREGDFEGALVLIDEIMATQKRKERWHYIKAELLHNSEDLNNAKLEYLNTKSAISKLSNRMKNTPAMRNLLEQTNGELIYIETTLNENPTSFKQKTVQKK